MTNRRTTPKQCNAELSLVLQSLVDSFAPGELYNKYGHTLNSAEVALDIGYPYPATTLPPQNQKDWNMELQRVFHCVPRKAPAR